MITGNVIGRTFRLRSAAGGGTCFAIDVDDLQYLVTALHVVPANGHGEDIVIDIHHEGSWRQLRTRVAWLSASLDTIILAPEVNLAGGAKMVVDTKIGLGQSVYLCGFTPLALFDDKGVNSGFPMALVRHGTVAGAGLANQPGTLVIDGHNLPGFSGGPVVFQPEPHSDFRVAAVIHGYKQETFTAQPNDNDDENAEANLTVAGNSGLTIAHFFMDGVKHLKKHPCRIDPIHH